LKISNGSKNGLAPNVDKIFPEFVTFSHMTPNITAILKCKIAMADVVYKVNIIHVDALGLVHRSRIDPGSVLLDRSKSTDPGSIQVL